LQEKILQIANYASGVIIMQCAIVIPSLNPSQRLVDLVDDLTRSGEIIIIVNDGSAEEHLPLFNLFKGYPNVTVLHHDINRGKGAALKTAFNYILTRRPEIGGIVTADSDGQHTPGDILHISEVLQKANRCLVLGVREFDPSTTPKKSLYGNRTVSRAFKSLFGVDISDTQTGLRGIPRRELSWMTAIRGERFEYEMNMLIQASRRRLTMLQIPIETIYIDANRASHFKAVRDTWRITVLMLRALINRGVEHKDHVNRRRTQLDWRRTNLAIQPYGNLFLLTRGILRIKGPRLTVQGALPRRPVVFVGHHQNLKGALAVMVWLRIPVRLWMLEVFCEEDSCYHQYADYTFTARFGIFTPLAKVAAFIASRYVPRLGKAMRVIPVYRNPQQALDVTFAQTVDALCNNENIVIFPDIDYSNDGSGMESMYTGFIHLEKYYYQRRQRHLIFVPIRLDEETNTLQLGKPISAREGEPFGKAKRRIEAELLAQLNRAD